MWLSSHVTKVIKSRLTDGLKLVTFYLTQNSLENLLARSRSLF